MTQELSPAGRSHWQARLRSFVFLSGLVPTADVVLEVLPMDQGLLAAREVAVNVPPVRGWKKKSGTKENG